jgi:type I restriction enzyme S subunit
MKYIRLSDCAYYSDLRTKSIDLETYISTENMLPNKGGISQADSIPDIKTTSKYEPNDILLSNIRPYFCKIWFANREGGCSNDVLVIKAKENYLPKFLYYVLSDQNFFNYDTVTSKGTKMPRGTPNAIMKYLVPDIGKDKQEIIVKALSAYDNLIENNNKRIKILEQMAENLYKEWFVRFRFPGHETTPIENGIPHGWEIMVAEDRYNITIGKTPPRKEFEWFTSERDNAQNWLSISDMTDIFVEETSEQLTYEAVKRFNMIVVPKDTILLSFKLTVGRVAIAMDKLCTNEAIAHFKNFNEYEREYLFLMLKNYDYNKLGNTSAIGNAINSKIVKAMKLTVPSESVLKAFHSATKPIFDQISNIMQQNQKLIKQRDLLLPRLMSGKLAV